MNMNILMMIVIIILIVDGTEVAIVDQCICERLLSQGDCKSQKGCDWSRGGSVCQKLDSEDDLIVGYCGLISDGSVCSKTKGCAYVESKCQIFGGCTAYKGVNNIECQTISKFCNSDGDAFCVEAENCNSYKTLEECQSKSSNIGSGICIWESSCREQKCNEGDVSLNTDIKCNNFINGCKTTGKGCIDQLGLCQSYSGDIESCEGLKGSDGYCKGVEGKDKCILKECSDADITLTTDEDCNKYQIGCITNGYGCTKSPLGSCNTQTGDDVICSQKIGQDGKCKGIINGKICSVVECKDAPITYSSNTDCEKYKSGCITTGKGCTHSLGTCSTYKGTIQTCEGYIGIEGKCKGISDIEESCQIKDCKDADSTFDTNEKCQEYQIGCQTTGKGCILTLKDCSSYIGNETNCNGYIGTDGKCTGGSTNGSCYPKKCSDAPITFITNQECSDYQIKCIANETGGCIDAGDCNTLIIQNQCEGKSTCQWKPQCVLNETCSDLKTEILCKTVTLQNSNTCWWINSTCVIRTCNQAPETYDTDLKCDIFLKGCLTTKKGCVDSNTPCTSYKGNKTTCQGFTIKCTNSDDATDTSTCKDPVCSENSDATTDDTCKQFHRNCLTNGKGCISISENCNQYPGTSTEICGKFKGNNQQNPCWWKMGNTCVNKVCTDADSSYISDDSCDKFLKGCVTTGAGCIGKSEECNAYKGLSQESCLKLSKGCSRREKCTLEITCDKIEKPTQQESCDTILPNRCIFIKDKCYSISNCNTYPGSSVEDCKNLVDLNQQKCYWTIGSLCTFRTCSQILNPSDLTVCTSHSSQCAKSNDGKKCIDVDIDQCGDIGIPNPANEEQCQKYHPKCHFGIINGIQKCTLIKRCNQYGPSKDVTCSTLIGLGVCKQNINIDDTCLDDSCNSFANDEVKCKQNSVYSISANLPIPCFYFTQNNTTKCEIKSCDSAVSHLGIVSSFEDCNKYYEKCVYSKENEGKCIDGGCTLIMGSQDDCLQLKGRYSIGSKNEFRLCYKHNNVGISNCIDRTCNQKQGNTDTICQEWLSTCKTDGQNCVDISTACTTMEGTNDSCKQLTGIVFGSKCQGNISIQGDCVTKRCQDNGTAKTDQDCDKFLKGCITTGNGCIESTTTCTKQWGNQNLCKQLTGNGKQCWSLSITNKGPCIDRICSHNTEAQTNDECNSFLKDCLTKNPGCIESTAECSSYQGIKDTCEQFVGNGKTCTNDTTATVTTTCKIKDCTKYIVDQYSESLCQLYGKHCHYNGIKCNEIQKCSDFKGNFITCAMYVATDGPCKGTALQTQSPTSCSIANCSDAPFTLQTDIECDKYKKGCKTNGHGCSETITCEDVQLSDVCNAVTRKKDEFSVVTMCTWASQCRDIEKSCSSLTSQSICASSKVNSGLGICIWKKDNCTDATCEDLPITISSNQDCIDYSQTCTFAGNGNGCVTKGSCSSYTRKEICIASKSTDKINSCAWDESIEIDTLIKGCRQKQCKDAPITLTIDNDCNSFIKGCISNGAGCMDSIFTCDMLKTQKKCIQDSTFKPCLWVNNNCQQYYNCNDLQLTTLSACQAVSKYCTLDENKCTSMKKCADYKNNVQCKLGTDGLCGWSTSNSKCLIFTQCIDLISKVNTECSSFNTKCISNGTNCIDKAECAIYGDSETACNIGGIDGNCYFDKNSPTCRLRQCADATSSTTTHNECFRYQINADNKCTTDGTKCIPLADCSSYTKQASCNIDSQYKICIWNTTTKTCKLKTCSDIKKTKSLECDSALIGCISDGIKCIDKAKCIDYTTKEACNNGGIDGYCTFTLNPGSTLNGTCKLFTQCSDANLDQIACQSKPLSCKWTTSAGTNPSSCTNHTCDTAAKGTAKCVTVPSFDGLKYTICQSQAGKCIATKPNTLNQDTCYKMSQYTYTWNPETQTCVSCAGPSSPIKNNSSNVNNTQNNNTTQTVNNHALYLYTIPFFISLII